MTIQDIIEKYKDKIDHLDIEILMAHSLGKTREFVLTYPDFKIPTPKIEKLELKISRRIKHEPIAYITGCKEFYGLNFIVNNHTLVPRPETELMVEKVLSLIPENNKSEKIKIIDVGTGSGNIIVSIAHAMEHEALNIEQDKEIRFFGIDISTEALKVAKKNAKKNSLDKKIKFMHGNLLQPVLECSMLHVPCSIIITANLPYLSVDIYNNAPMDVKKYEPKSALYSAEAGLAHYRKLLEQLKNILSIHHLSSTIILLEISPEQKLQITKLIKSIFPSAKTELVKDLAGKWRLCKINIS